MDVSRCATKAFRKKTRYPCTSVYLGYGGKEERSNGEGDEENAERCSNQRLACDVVVLGNVRESRCHHGRAEGRDKGV